MNLHFQADISEKSGYKLAIKEFFVNTFPKHVILKAIRARINKVKNSSLIRTIFFFYNKYFK